MKNFDLPGHMPKRRKRVRQRRLSFLQLQLWFRRRQKTTTARSHHTSPFIAITTTGCWPKCTTRGNFDGRTYRFSSWRTAQVGRTIRFVFGRCYIRVFFCGIFTKKPPLVFDLGLLIVGQLAFTARSVTIYYWKQISCLI